MASQARAVRQKCAISRVDRYRYKQVKFLIMVSSPSVLIVEDNEGHSYLIEEKFKSAFPQAEIHNARTLREASRILPKKEWDLVILNSRLPDGRGTDFLDKLSIRQPFAAVAILTENVNDEEMVSSQHHGVVEFLTKDRQTLESFVSRVKRLMASSQGINRLLDEKTGSSSGHLFRDPLTGAYSRAFLIESLHREISRANRYNQEISLLIVDIDHFQKMINKKNHKAGERCLKKISSILVNSIRAGDIVARYKARKFIHLLSQCPRAEAVQCAQRVLDRVKKGAGTDRFTVSIGVMYYKGVSKISRPQEIITGAERALAQAKSKGGNRFLVAA